MMQLPIKLLRLPVSLFNEYVLPYIPMKPKPTPVLHSFKFSYKQFLFECKAPDFKTAHKLYRQWKKKHD